MRRDLCNVIATELIELEAYSGQFLRPGEIEERARQEWEEIEVPGNDYPRTRTRYEGVQLSEDEVQYVLLEVKTAISRPGF